MGHNLGKFAFAVDCRVDLRCVPNGLPLFVRRKLLKDPISAVFHGVRVEI